ncbi:MAG: LysR family transcriptional regulator [Lachnospiraceae bacterium]|nr:LysR family transcriptional regulator [Lachnospiraceae bacterium]
MMETKSIQEFLMLAKTGSSYAAAEKLFISQSSLVRHIQALEEEFGVPLFDRTRRGFTLNASGKVFLPYAQKIALLQSQCYRELHPEQESSDTLRIASDGKIVDLIIDFKKAYPDYVIDYRKSEDMESDLRDGRIEVAFLSTMASTHEGLTSIPFYEEEVLAVLYEGHPLAGRDSVRLEELQDERFVSLCEDIVFDDAFLEKYRMLGLERKASVSVPVGTDLMRLVKEKIGIALIHGNADATPTYPELSVVRLEPRMRYRVCMCYRSEVRLSEPAQDFVNFAKRWRVRIGEVNQCFDAF